MFDDSLNDILGPQTTSSPKNSFSGKKGKKESLWEKEHAPYPFDKDKLVNKVNEIFIRTNEELPDNVKTVIGSISTTLVDNGYTLRSTGSSKDPGQEVGSQSFKSKVEHYLPWEGFNQLTSDRGAPGEDYFRIAAWAKYKYNNSPPVIKAFLANETRVILGDDLATPIKFLLTWTMDGASTKKQTNFQTGYSSYAIDLCSDMDIPVFNLGGDGFPRLKAFLDN